MVRKHTIEGINLLSQHFGHKWILEKVIPRLNQLWEFEENSYIQRNTVVLGLESCCEKIDIETIKTLIFPTLLKGLNDPISNVKFVTLRSIYNLCSKQVFKGKLDLLKSTFINDIDKIIHSNGVDAEVSYFANKAKESLK